MPQIYSKDGPLAATDGELIASCVALKPLVYPPFSEKILSCLQVLSKRLLNSEYSRAMPQIMALGYWVRPSAIKTLQANLQNAEENSVLAPRGVAFHLPPQNVDTLFAYSWVLSYLVGNCNVVRVGRNPSEVSRWLIDKIIEVLDEVGEDHRNVFCTYDFNSNCTSDISKLSDLRVIWGGDEKIQTVSRFVTRPDGLTLGFSDRKSMCLINTSVYKKLSVDQKKSIAQDFFNDLFWFDQLGCGSPRLLGWVGESSPDSEEFYGLLEQVAQEKGYVTDTGIDLQKFAFANLQLAHGRASLANRVSANLMVIDAKAEAKVFDQVMGGGLIYQVQLPTLVDAVQLLRSDLQTITEFGFDQAEKIEFAGLMGLKGGFRIVPIGKALEFNSVWDGVGLLSHFTRKVTIL